METDDRFFLPPSNQKSRGTQPLCSFVRPIALAPVVELAGGRAQPGDESAGTDLGLSPTSAGRNPAPDPAHHAAPRSRSEFPKAFSQRNDRYFGGTVLVPSGGAFTVSVSGVLVFTLPDVPLIITVAVPFCAVGPAVRVSVLLEVAGLGLKDAVTPEGSLPVDRVTLSENPSRG
jgi:hypothetical protein